MENLKKIKINRPLLKEIRIAENYAKNMKDLVATKPRIEEDEEIRMNPRCSALLQNQLPLKEQDPGSFILPCSIGRLDFNNALADLGASISIMPLSMYKCLGIGKLKPINMTIILDMVEDLRMPISLGRPLLATSHATVDIFRKSISLEVGNEKVVFKMKSSLTTNFESVCSIRSEEFLGDDDSKKINDDLFLYETYEFNQLLSTKPDTFSYEIDVQESYDKAVCKISEVEYTRVHWCKQILQVKENIYQYWASCDPNSNICDEGDVPINKDTRYWECNNDSKREESEWD
ncbi:hypothetical protein Tco_0960510 [Tanacetum coccineum]